MLRNLLCLLLCAAALTSPRAADENSSPKRTGLVKVSNHALQDDSGPFLGLGVSYFTALWRCKNDRDRLHADFKFLSAQGFNYYRMLSMVGYYPAWEGLEIAPVSFRNKEDRPVPSWSDYWQQLVQLVDLGYDQYGLRAQITIFADAQLMPRKEQRLDHMRRLLQELGPGRAHKVILFEVANEAWQNGFPGDQGVADLREFATFLAERTEVPVAITSTHDYPELGSLKGFEQVYANSSADIATWHFSRDRRTDEGWKPVYDPWELGLKAGYPPVSSNEPIGPGSSVNAERDPLRLVMAAAFAYTASLPMYVFHCEAGVFGKTTFEGTPGIDQYKSILRLLPPDLPNWPRNDGKESSAPFTMFSSGQPNKHSTEMPGAQDGCIRNVGATEGKRFVTLPIGIQPKGLVLEARHDLRFTAHNPLNGDSVLEKSLAKGERLALPQGLGAYIVLGEFLQPR